MPVTECTNLPAQNVLAVILSARDDENPRIYYEGLGYRRVAEAYEKDFYYLLHYDDMWSLHGIDESDLPMFWDINDPWGEFTRLRKGYEYVIDTKIFIGAKVNDEKWAEALEVFNGIH